MIQHYVTFLHPGSFMPNESSLKIKSRDEKFTIPDTCFAYYFWDREEVEQDGEILYGKKKNKSGRYYFGEVMTVDEVIEKIPNSDILVSNMKCNRWDKVVRTRRGNFQPLMEEDKIVSP